MIGKSLREYVFIRVCIFALRAIAPLSIAYLGVCLYIGRKLVSPWLALYAAAEAGFYFFVYLPRCTHLQTPAIHPPLISREQRQALFTRCFDLVKNTDVISGWFYGAPIETLQRDNIVDWILWGFFALNGDGQGERQEILETWRKEIDNYVSRIEELAGQTFPPGRNATVKSMRVTLDPVVTLHRPLVWYFLIFLVDNITFVILSSLGFRHHATKEWFNIFPPRPLTLLSRPRPLHPHISYWYRPHRSTTRQPLVFLHGLGIGLWPYCSFLAELVREDPDVGIIMLEFLPISMRMTSAPLGREALCSALDLILKAHDIQSFVLVGHSFGTVTGTYILRSPLASRVAGTVFVDPIPFLLVFPNVAWNFVYRAPREANEWQLWYFASRDPDISRTLARHFFWSECVMFREELEGRKTAVALCGADQIVHAEEVRQYLTGEDKPSKTWSKDGLQVLFFPDLDHAHIFETKANRKVLLDVIRTYSTMDEKSKPVLEELE